MTWTHTALAGLLLVVGVLTPALAKDPASGPAVGSSPMLQLDAVNDDGDAYCFTCRAGRNPAAIVFVTRDDEATRTLIHRLHALAEAGREQRLATALVLVGDGEHTTSLAELVKEHRLAVPTAVVNDAEALRPWALHPEVATTAVLLKGHKVSRSLANPDADALDHAVHGLLGGGGGHAHH